jgi:hypothetical protein
MSTPTPLFKHARELAYGDLIDLHADPYANGDEPRLIYQYVYAIVTEIVAVDPDAVAVAVLCSGGEYSFVCPLDHTIRLADLTPADTPSSATDHNTDHNNV